MKIIVLGLLLAVLASCASIKPLDQIPDSAFDVLTDKGSEPSPREDTSGAIDYESLQRSLGLERPVESLGFLEKPFNTCDVGYGYSSSQNCRQAYFVVIHFQLLCRDSEGTISTSLSREELRPLSLRSIRWNLKKVQGLLQLDPEGYGQIKTTSESPQKYQRLRLAADKEFLYMRAGEITRVVTPRQWCN